MEIEIPENVNFLTNEWRGGQWHWRHYCFPHAVLRALEGEKIKVSLQHDPFTCDDCTEFMPPQSHDLSGLRR